MGEYLKNGLVLVPVPMGAKGPTAKGWNLREGCIADPTQARRLVGANIGLALAYCDPPIGSVDFDDYETAALELERIGIDVDRLLAAEDAVQIRSGRPNRAKLLYRLPEPLPSVKMLPVLPLGNGSDEPRHALELRCGTWKSLTVQDLLPPSIHPETRKPYEWAGAGDWRLIPPIPPRLLDLWRDELSQRAAPAAAASIAGTWERIDVGSIPNLSEWSRRLIREGDTQGKYPSRSEAMFGAIKDLIRADCTDEEICRVMADPEHAISAKALEERRGDLGSAMEWIARQIPKARAEVEKEPRVEFGAPPLKPGDACSDSLDREQQADAGGQASHPFTEDFLAQRFADKTHPKLRYVAAWGYWMGWTGQRWKRDGTLAVFDEVRNLCRAYAASADNPKIKIALSKAATVSAVERLARSDRRIAATVAQWDADPWIINTTAGMVFLPDGAVRPHDPGAYCTKMTGAAPKGDCPRWLAFLADVTDKDRDLEEFLRRMAGYVLSGSTREHALFFLYGIGGNGKGVFLNTLTHLLGDYASVAPMEMFTERRTDQHPTELAMLQGARLVVAQETEAGRRWAESRIKSLTGGDPVTARFMRADFFTYTPQFKLVIAGNHKPHLRNVDEAMRRRLHLVPFTVTIPREKRDPDLEAKLREEWGGILAWAIEGCKEYLERGLNPPARVREATDAYFEDQDDLSTWLADCCEEGPGFWEPTGLLFASWCRWTEASGLHPGSQKTFAERLQAMGHRLTRSGQRGRHWLGLRVRPEATAAGPTWSRTGTGDAW